MVTCEHEIERLGYLTYATNQEGTAVGHTCANANWAVFQFMFALLETEYEPNLWPNSQKACCLPCSVVKRRPCNIAFPRLEDCAEGNSSKHSDASTTRLAFLDVSRVTSWSEQIRPTPGPAKRVSRPATQVPRARHWEADPGSQQLGPPHRPSHPAAKIARDTQAACLFGAEPGSGITIERVSR